MRRFPIILTLALLGLIRVSGWAADHPIRTLIVDGFSNHDWNHTTALIRQVLEASGGFDVAVTTTPRSPEDPAWASWRPPFQEFDIVIQNCNDIGGGPQWPEPVQKDFEQYVRAGGGVFMFHSANNAFPNWPAYNEMIGLGWRKAEFGVALEISPEGEVIRIPPGEGRGTGHGPRVNALVHRMGNHPIHEGLPRHWRASDIEVYYYARGPARNLEVLSYAHDVKTGKNWPVEWAVQFGGGRIYNSTFGHVWRNDPQPLGMRCAGFQTLMVRACQWLAGRPVNTHLPRDFPVEDRISLRAEFK